MTPLSDRNSDLWAWADKDGHVFSHDLEWVAFMRDGHAFAAATCGWLGPVVGATIFDQSGDPILWNPDCDISEGTPFARPPWPPLPLRPLRPPRPFFPPCPSPPLTPLGAWSVLTPAEWLAQA